MSDDLTITQNNTIYSEDGSKAVSVITDGSIERLAVDIKESTDEPTVTNISALVSAGYVYSFAGQVNMTSSGVDNPLLYIENPTGSGVTFYLYEGRFGVNVSNNYANVKFWSQPTITANGTAYTPVNRCLGGGFGSSAMNVYTLPTVSSNGTQVENLEVAENGNSIFAATHFALHMQANQRLLITGDPKSNNREAAITLVWAEF